MILLDDRLPDSERAEKSEAPSPYA